MLDFHNHVIPGVDDGSESVEQSITALKRMWEQGITHVIATPHLRASVAKQPAEFDHKMREIDDCWRALLDAAKEKLPQINLYRGVELALDDPDPVVADLRLRLAETRFVLVEFPWFLIPPNSTHPLERLRAGGYTPIVAHPERYDNVDDDLGILRDWKLQGAFLQVNAGSLIGAYGTRIESKAWRILEAGLADYLSSDYHARGVCLVKDACARITERGGATQVKILSQNGSRLLEAETPMPVPLLRVERSRWARLRKAISSRRGR